MKKLTQIIKLYMLVVLLCILSPIVSSAKSDSLNKPFTFFKIGTDITKIIKSVANNPYKTYEINAEANLKQQLNLYLEVGWGNAFLSNQYLRYTSKNVYIKPGILKTLFTPVFRGDNDNAFVGINYALSIIQRSQAQVNIIDVVYGNYTTTVPPQKFWAHWLELQAGFKIEILKRVFIGWAIQPKFFFNPKKLEELAPYHIAGYGRGDKNTSFEYKFYLQYAIGNRYIHK